MSATQISVTFLTFTSASPSVMSTQTVTIPIPSSLTALDSGQLASGQTGYNALDTLINAIAKRSGITYTDASGIVNFIPMNQITKIIGA